MQTILLVAHIAVLGYWLGSELVINSEYRFICTRDDLPFAARDAMMDHLMKADQHVRYALVLQLMLGTMLMSQSGLLPVSHILLLLIGLGWLGFVELVHRCRTHPSGAILGKIDRVSRYVLILLLLGAALMASLPFWLSIKLALFAGVMLCGVGIRLMLIRHFRIWSEMKEDGPRDESNAAIKRICAQATSILVLLWLCIAVIVTLSITKVA
jgi:hypothetical protein